MKHAIMVAGFGKNAEVIQETINVLDDEDIDFFIHWDKKYKLPKLTSQKSKITFINRISVNWGTDKQIKVENMLMKSVIQSSKKYEYVHLISSNDIPMMTVEYFKKYFKPGTHYIGYIDYIDDYSLSRVKYYYPIRRFSVRSHFWDAHIMKIIRFVNRIFKVNRIKDINVEKGCNWFSMDIKYAKRVVNYPNIKRFMNTYAGDEFYVQTILYDLKPDGISQKYNYYSDDYRMTHSSEMALRYIDWYRARPYTFTLEDFKELKNNLNTKYAFARKIDNPEVVKKMFKDVNSKRGFLNENDRHSSNL
ncbi:beta-1,6-N-acetylglucosaminyltransferase [Apilactobacillus nanyangensis]|uniref:beta-1,6-N-acetylglucosaminyltransferase n=1 Tax=Apilactobacillus nanyangensis TaxID=2799579 RepID=UPI001944A0DD|nr:beta-1,6-N-acetylglucosaminyltransferase [Apilactobacillus nanyangensis]